MAINNDNDDLTHVIRTTEQWENTADKYEIIPVGVLCVEFTPTNKTNVKIGNGHKPFKDLPYVSGSGSDLVNYYTREETDNRINEIIDSRQTLCICGSVNSFSSLPTINRVGDIWFVRTDKPGEHDVFDEYVWSIQHKWELIGSSRVDIDLSDYAKKEYVDKSVGELREELDEVRDYAHTHKNKLILDSIDAVYDKEKDNKLASLHNYDDTEIRQMMHEHSNKQILDATDAVYTKSKDSKLSSLHNYDDSELRERVEDLEDVCVTFTPATSSSSGKGGFVPAPTQNDINKVLSSNGGWVEIEATTVEIATRERLGIVKIGDSIDVTDEGVISTNISDTIINCVPD